MSITRRWVLLSVAVLLGALIWVNARFVLLAIESQPGCVPHVRGDPGAASPDRPSGNPGATPSDTVTYRAAKSSC